MNIVKFQPSNGTVGSAFVGQWCGTCARAVEAPCDIAARTMWLKVEDPEYPNEWRFVEGNPVCTAHIELGQPIPEPRCKHTAELFHE